MWERIVFFFSFFVYCTCNYHGQYRVPSSCSENWETYTLGDKDYIVQTLPVRWTDANILCRGHHNATLAMVDTLEKAEFLAEALAESQFSLEAVWVGARRASSDDPEGYRWVPAEVPLRRTANDVLGHDEAERHFPTWLNRTHVPVPDGGADCVALDRINHDYPVFLDLPCEVSRPFVCEREALQDFPVRQLRVVRCKSGLYHVYSGRLTWDQAAAYCVMRKMTLANIATMKCLKKLGMTMLKARPSIESAWVGARGQLGDWTWTDSGISIFKPPAIIDVEPALWPPMRDRETVKQSGCLQLDRHASHPPVFMEARCERKMEFICYEGNKLALQSLRKYSEPPSDDNYYYVLVRQNLYWQHAFDNCIKMKGTLAFIDSNEILIQLLLVMGENKDEPVDHIWVAGRLNVTKDPATDTASYIWYNPSTNKRINDNAHTDGGYMPPWLDDDLTIDNTCLNLDRQNHLTGLVYGIQCDTPQYSVCMIEKQLGVPPTTETVIVTTQHHDHETVHEVSHEAAAARESPSEVTEATA